MTAMRPPAGCRGVARFKALAGLVQTTGCDMWSWDAGSERCDVRCFTRWAAALVVILDSSVVPFSETRAAFSVTGCWRGLGCMRTQRAASQYACANAGDDRNTEQVFVRLAGGQRVHLWQL